MSKDTTNPLIITDHSENWLTISDHKHNGFDSSRIMWKDLVQRKIFVSHTVVGADAATAANYGVFWIARFKGYVSGFSVVHQVASTSGTLQLEKLTGTTAPDSGVNMLSSALSLSSTANTVQSGVLTTTLADINFNIGDRLCLKDAGTLTNGSNVTVVVEITLI